MEMGNFKTQKNAKNVLHPLEMFFFRVVKKNYYANWEMLAVFADIVLAVFP